ncbi:hypothetical cytosolic protein [Streptococcus pseudoporcinus]|uniref:Epoxyqueuosine reductase QueH n=1 Tax=Streptococcus pseudoporcinus TaxID=361101 RepID=A0A4U9XK14_9STRE|nr:epoxyqueuosine reductase QueH [Streptococcus pseudoporcinus]VTS13613.1 hypothetical cytosolic protein [Streptococcus pseudoporcinus]
MINVEDVLSKAKPNQKINYDKLMQEMRKDWLKKEIRPRILMHVCCAPCSTYSLEYLADFADITVYFANSNIHPKTEYQRRALVTQEFIKAFNEKTGHDVAYIEELYQPNNYIKKVRGLEDEPEGGARCRVCFDYRLDLTARKAVELDFDYFASALTISPHKNASLINQIGIDIQKCYRTKYLPSDFKKNNGYRRSVQMCQEYDIYRQCYCGCVYAARSQGVDLKQVKMNAKAYLDSQQSLEESESSVTIPFIYQGKELKNK